MKNSQEKGSIAEIFERDCKVYGKVIKLFPIAGERPDPNAPKCLEDDGLNEKIQ